MSKEILDAEVIEKDNTHLVKREDKSQAAITEFPEGTPTKVQPAPMPLIRNNHLALALSKAQSAIRTPKKTKTVDFIDKNNRRVHYKYADLADVLDCIREPLAQNELAFLHQLGYTHSMYGLTTFLYHSSGQMVSTWYPLPDPLKSNIKAQEFGSALTYARRYSLSSLLGIASEEDDDGGNAGDTTPPKPRGRGAQNGQPQESKTVQHNNSADTQGKTTAVNPADVVLLSGPDGVKGRKIGEVPLEALKAYLAFLKAEMDIKPRVALFNQHAQMAGRVRAFLAMQPKEAAGEVAQADTKPTQQERKQYVNKEPDPGKYMIPKSILDTDGKTLDQMPEDMLKNILNWIEKEMKTTPPPAHLPLLFEASQRIRAFLRSVRVEA